MVDLRNAENMWNVARLGENYSDRPVDRIMDDYTQYLDRNKPKNTWEDVKNFASGNIGRPLLGGLGTALAVGLTGGSAKDALSYGLLGAGHTADNLQRQWNIEQRQQQEQQRQQAYLNQQKELQEARFKEARELADLNEQRALNRMYLENELRMSREGSQQTNAITNYEYLRNIIPEDQARATAFGGNTEAVGNALVGGFGNDFGLQGKALDKYNEARAANIANAESNYFNSMAKHDQTMSQLGRLKDSIKNNPTVAGPYSGWNELYKRYTNNNDQWMKDRGALVNQLVSAGNILIEQANASGVTGINSLPEVERIIGTLNANNSPRELEGAIEKIEELSSELNERAKNVYNSYRKPYQNIGYNQAPAAGDTDEIIDFMEFKGE